jgi:hypothetical protein
VIPGVVGSSPISRPRSKAPPGPFLIGAADGTCLHVEVVVGDSGDLEGAKGPYQFQQGKFTDTSAWIVIGRTMRPMDSEGDNGAVIQRRLFDPVTLDPGVHLAR